MSKSHLNVITFETMDPENRSLSEFGATENAGLFRGGTRTFVREWGQGVNQKFHTGQILRTSMVSRELQKMQVYSGAEPGLLSGSESMLWS